MYQSTVTDGRDQKKVEIDGGKIMLDAVGQVVIQTGKGKVWAWEDLVTSFILGD